MDELKASTFKRWTHSREEDVDGEMVFRPSDYSFPPARGREGLEFRQNGEFLQYGIGPGDRSQAVKGRWRTTSSNVIEVEFPQGGARPYRLVVTQEDDDVLKVRREFR
jgi:hypothetical protein